jgi:GTP cyclohydrolase I
MKSKYYVTWEEIFIRLKYIDRPENIVYGIPKGGMIAAGFLKHAKRTHDPKEANYLLDDIIDTGKTIRSYTTKINNKCSVYGLYDLLLSSEDAKFYKDKWLVFPWEQEHPAGVDTIEQNITRQLQYIGEDTTREGLIDTPKRVIKSYGEIFAGYNQNPKDIFTCFESDGYDQIILLKSFEFYSLCEHHILPFFGKAHVAYIPNEKIVGISKLARLVDLYSKRLQIQERIGLQVTNDLMTYLKPKGAACILEATHLCMRMRGVEKQNSIMTTSSLTGVFLDDPAAKNELIQLIKL